MEEGRPENMWIQASRYSCFKKICSLKKKVRTYINKKHTMFLMREKNGMLIKKKLLIL